MTSNFFFLGLCNMESNLNQHQLYAKYFLLRTDLPRSCNGRPVLRNCDRYLASAWLLAGFIINAVHLHVVNLGLVELPDLKDAGDCFGSSKRYLSPRYKCLLFPARRKYPSVWATLTGSRKILDDRSAVVLRAQTPSNHAW